MRGVLLRPCAPPIDAAIPAPGRGVFLGTTVFRCWRVCQPLRAARREWTRPTRTRVRRRHCSRRRFFDGVLVRDGWARRIAAWTTRCSKAAWPTCFGAVSTFETTQPRSRWAVQVEAVLQAGLALRDRRDDGRLTDHGLASVRGRLLARLGPLIDAPATARRRRAVRRASRHGIRRRVRLPLGPVGRRYNWRAEPGPSRVIGIRKKTVNTTIPPQVGQIYRRHDKTAMRGGGDMTERRPPGAFTGVPRSRGCPSLCWRRPSVPFKKAGSSGSKTVRS